jgi:hypothetical protein
MEACDINLNNYDPFCKECLCSIIPRLMSPGKYTMKEIMIHGEGILDKSENRNPKMTIANPPVIRDKGH